MKKVAVVLFFALTFFSELSHAQKEFPGLVSPDGKKEIVEFCTPTECRYEVSSKSPGYGYTIVAAYRGESWDSIQIYPLWSADSRYLAVIISTINPDGSIEMGNDLKWELAITDLNDPEGLRRGLFATAFGCSDTIDQLPPIEIYKDFGGLPADTFVGFKKSSFFYVVNDDATKVDKWDEPDNVRHIEVNLKRFNIVKTKKIKVFRVIEN